MTSLVEQDPMHWLVQERGDKPLYLETLNGYLVFYDALNIRGGVIVLRDALKKARDIAKSLESRVIEGVHVTEGNTITLAQYVNAVRELKRIGYGNLKYPTYGLLENRLALLDTFLEFKAKTTGDGVKVVADVYQRGESVDSNKLIVGVNGFIAEFDPKSSVPIEIGNGENNDFYFFIHNLSSSSSITRALLGAKYRGVDVLHAGYPLDAKVTIPLKQSRVVGIVVPIVLRSHLFSLQTQAYEGETQQARGIVSE